MYPFSSIVGQEEAKLALMLSAVEPDIGGVLLSGVKGTGKSTLVRALPGILPAFDAVADCQYNCPLSAPEKACDICRAKMDSGEEIQTVELQPELVTVPLGTTEDRLLGAVDIERLLSDGELHFNAGLLAKANNQILYIDEVNLLPDNLTDDILDAAASRKNTVEREGVSVTHPARFTLIGTMNPEEGQLRPQILDRFALSVNIETVNSPELRAEIVTRALTHSLSPEKFERVYSKGDIRLRKRIAAAKMRLPEIKIPGDIIKTVAMAMAQLGVDGQRPDIVTIKCAIVFAALEEDKKVSMKHVNRVAPMAVCHRTRNGGLNPAPEKSAVLDALDKSAEAMKKGMSKSPTLTLSDLAEHALELAIAAIKQASEESKKN